MSAYVVHPATVQLVVRAATDQEVLDLLRDAYPFVTFERDEARGAACRYLACMNVRSVQYRYGGESVDTLPGFRHGEWVEGAAYYPMPDIDEGKIALRGELDGSLNLDLARRVLGALHCFEYQSCELPEWSGSPAWRFVREVEHRVAGYVATGWEYDGERSVAIDADECAS